MNDYLSRGQAAIQARNTEEAIKWFEFAVKEDPKDAQSLACLGQAQCWHGRIKDGLTYLRLAGRFLEKKAKKKRDTKELVMLAEQLQFWNDYEGSLDLLKSTVQIKPNEVRGFQLLSLAYSRLNQGRDALTAGKRALKLAPENMVLNILLATLEAAEGRVDSAKIRLEKVLRASFSAEEKYRAHKELATLLDKEGLYDQVFEHLHVAAGFAKRLPEINKQNKLLVPNMLEANKAGFDRELLGRWSVEEFKQELPAPVFLMGFMRSGTTLSQEVIGTHGDIIVADEPDLIVAMRNELNRISEYQGTTPEQLKALDLSAIKELRAFYWRRAQGRFGDDIGSKMFLDKTTMNTIDIGLINCVFPDAKVVFVTRDPRDVCLSCFMQVMAPTPATVHLLDWRSTAEFYAAVMDWWMYIKQSLTLEWIEFRYEDAVLRFEATFRPVFDFLGLSWEENAIEFHKNASKKIIVSPSFNQVSRPLYQSSLARWKNYESEFGSIIDVLDPCIKAFRYDSRQE